MMKQRTASAARFASRRTVLRGVAAVGFSGVNFLVPRASYGQDAMTKELVFFTYGGSFGDAVREALVQPFEKEFGVKVHMAVTGNNAEMYAKLRAATMGGGPGEVDLFWNDLTFAYPAVEQGLVQPLRLENIPNAKSVISIFNKKTAKLPWDPGEGVHGLPAEIVPRNMGWNRKQIPGELTSIKELWNPAYKGKLGMYANTQWMIASACFYSGQDPNKIQDLDKVWRLLSEQKKIVGRYSDNWSEIMELYENQTISISPLVGGRATHLRRRGMDLGYVKPVEGALLNADLQMVPKGARNRFTAEKMIDFSYRPDVATKLSELLGYPLGTTNVQPTELVRSLPDYDPTNKYTGYIFPDPPYWIANLSKWTEKVREIQAS